MSVFAEFTLPVTAFPPGGRLSRNATVTVELERVVPTGSVTHYLWFVGDDYADVIKELRTDPAVESMDVLEELDDRALVDIHWQSMATPLFELIEESGAMLVDATGTVDGWTATFRFPDGDALTDFYEACRRRGVSLELREINESGLDEREDDFGLTQSQRETLAVAFEAGYFDVPRETTLADLAAELDVSEQAVSERLRRGLKTFLIATLHGEHLPDATDTERD